MAWICCEHWIICISKLIKTWGVCRVLLIKKAQFLNNLDFLFFNTFKRWKVQSKTSELLHTKYFTKFILGKFREDVVVNSLISCTITRLTTNSQQLRVNIFVILVVYEEYKDIFSCLTIFTHQLLYPLLRLIQSNRQNLLLRQLPTYFCKPVILILRCRFNLLFLERWLTILVLNDFVRKLIYGVKCLN